MAKTIVLVGTGKGAFLLESRRGSARLAGSWAVLRELADL